MVNTHETTLENSDLVGKGHSHKKGHKKHHDHDHNQNHGEEHEHNHDNIKKNDHNHDHKHDHKHEHGQECSVDYNEEFVVEGGFCLDTEGGDACCKSGCACADSIFVEKTEKQLVEYKNHERNTMIRILIATAMMVLTVVYEDFFLQYPNKYPAYFILIPAYFLVGWEVLSKTWEDLKDKYWYSERVLMTIATVGAFLTANSAEAVGVMVFYQLGEIIQSRTTENSRKSIRSILDIRPQIAHVTEGDAVYDISPKDLLIGDIVVVKPGEKVPIDGLLLTEESQFDTSPITGESRPRSIHKGEKVYEGIVNLTHSIKVKTTKPYEESSIARILYMIQDAEENKSKTERFITSFSRYYTPFVIILAFSIVIIPPFFTGWDTMSKWVYRAMIFLVISCPCALLVSVPLGYYGGIGAASRNGILIKGGNNLDVLAKSQIFLFDKTGTLTKGNFVLMSDNLKEKFEREDVLGKLAVAESHSTHPIAKAITDASPNYMAYGNADNFESIKSYGIRATVGMEEIIAGNDKILHKFEIDHNTQYCVMSGTVVHVAIDREYAGYFIISDQVKENAAGALSDLRALSIKDIQILSGDEEQVVMDMARSLNVSTARYGLLPVDKLNYLKSAQQLNTSVVYIGDGVNDAPVIAQADVGIAMGTLGSDAAIETADVVLVSDDLNNLPKVVRIARRTRQIIWQNIFLVFMVKALFLILAGLGLTSMWGALFADVGVAILAILNSRRMLYQKFDK